MSTGLGFSSCSDLTEVNRNQGDMFQYADSTSVASQKIKTLTNTDGSEMETLDLKLSKRALVKLFQDNGGVPLHKPSDDHSKSHTALLKG